MDVGTCHVVSCCVVSVSVWTLSVDVGLLLGFVSLVFQSGLFCLVCYLCSIVGFMGVGTSHVVFCCVVFCHVMSCAVNR